MNADPQGGRFLPRLYIWVMGKSKNHCVTCSSMAGTIGTWGSFGIRPKVHLRCGCAIVPLGYVEEEIKPMSKEERDELRSDKLGALNELRLEMFERQRESVPRGMTEGLEVGPMCYLEDEPAPLAAIGDASIGVEVESMLWDWDNPGREEWC